MVQKPPVPTACISGNCNQIWPGSSTSGCAGFRIFKRLWQTRGLENRVQLLANFLLCYQKIFVSRKCCH